MSFLCQLFVYLAHCAGFHVGIILQIKRYRDESNIQHYDTGLLISHAFDELGIVSEDLYRKLMFDKLEVNQGMLVENIIRDKKGIQSGHKMPCLSRKFEK